jgi:hypothetical protein
MRGSRPPSGVRSFFRCPSPRLVACRDVRPCRVCAERGCGLMGARLVPN